MDASQPPNNLPTASSNDEKTSRSGVSQPGVLTREFPAPPLAQQQQQQQNYAFHHTSTRAADTLSHNNEVYRSLAASRPLAGPTMDVRSGDMAPQFGAPMGLPHNKGAAPLNNWKNMQGSLPSATPSSFNKIEPGSSAITTASTSALGTANVSVPPPVLGGYLEPNRHFYTNAQPTWIMTAIRKTLSELDIDFDQDRSGFAFSCRAFHLACKVSFAIHVFSSSKNSKGDWIVEIQRRCGDVVRFSQTYGLILESLKNENVFETQVESRSSADETAQSSQQSWGGASSLGMGWTPLPLPDLDDLEFSDDDMEADAEAVAALVSMSASAYIDVSMQGLEALADMSQDCKAHAALIEADSVPMLIQRLESKDGNIRRCAATCLGNLAACSDVASSVVDQIDRVLRLCDCNCRQTAREASRLLAAVVASNKERVRCNDSVNACVTHLLCSADSPTRKFALSVQTSLSV
jgi:hypothetical protein